MSSSNPFRRKENQVLGLDNSSFVSSTDIASAVARIPDADSSRFHRSSVDANKPNNHAASVKGTQKRVRVISPHLSRTGAEAENVSEDEDTYHAALSRADDRTEYARSRGSYRSSVDGENPLSEDSNDEDEYEDEFDEEDFPPQRKGRRLVPFKANQTLNVDFDNPWRNSTAMGNLPGSGKPTDRNATSIPPKAQRTLGMSRTGRALDQEGYRRENSLSPRTDNVAPKALRTLGIPSNPFHRPSTADNQSVHSDEGDSHSIASAAHRQLDVDAFKRLLLSGRRAPAFDNSSSTDVSSNSRSSMLSSQSYRDTPRSSHEILPEDFNIRGHNRLVQRTPISLLSTKSRADSLVDPAAVLTEPFSPLSTLHPESPTDLNKPLPNTPKRPDIIFELPAQVPMSHYAPAQNTFIAELPASGPIAELPYETSGIVELPNNEVSDSPLSATSSIRTGTLPFSARRSGLTRAATMGHPNIAELDSPHPVELPSPASRTNPLHHAKTVPAMHASLQQTPEATPARMSSLPKRVDRAAIGGMPPASSQELQRSSSDYPPPLITNISRRQQSPPSTSSTTNNSTHFQPSMQVHQQIGESHPSMLKKYTQPVAAAPLATEESALPPNDRPSTPKNPTLAPEIPASPASASSGLEMIAKAAVDGAQRKGSTTSLRSLKASNAAAEARRKASSTSLGGAGSEESVVADLATLQKDVESLGEKIGVPKNSTKSTMAGQGTPPEAPETGDLGQVQDEVKRGHQKSKSDDDIEKSEIQRAVQSAADEAVGSTSGSRQGSMETKPITHFEESSSSSDETTPKASDTEGIKEIRSE
ncbi:hypothetical protein MMC10_008201 [Thelotrema lepadinum]|nr:hypothetical protein [Thelotrema lepadinum]